MLCTLEAHIKRLFQSSSEFFPREIFLNLRSTFPRQYDALPGLSLKDSFLMRELGIGDFEPFAQEDAHV